MQTSTSLFLSGSLRRWVTKDLYRGDLSALADLACGRIADVTYDQIGALKNRGFVRKNFFRTHLYCVTVKGYVALLLRVTIARDRAPLTEGLRDS